MSMAGSMLSPLLNSQVNVGEPTESCAILALTFAARKEEWASGAPIPVLMEGWRMQTYELYIEDSRYSVPTLVFVIAVTDGRAKARATELLLQSPCHASVDIWKAGRLLFTVSAGRRQLAAPGRTIPDPTSPRLG